MGKLIGCHSVDSTAALNQDDPTIMTFVSSVDCLSQMAGEMEPVPTDSNQLISTVGAEIQRSLSEIPGKKRKEKKNVASCASIFADWRRCNWWFSRFRALICLHSIRSLAISSFGFGRFGCHGHASIIFSLVSSWVVLSNFICNSRNGLEWLSLIDVCIKMISIWQLVAFKTRSLLFFISRFFSLLFFSDRLWTLLWWWFPVQAKSFTYLIELRRF